jgi:UDP-N-acetylmuramate dehydrogenase
VVTLDSTRSRAFERSLSRRTSLRIGGDAADIRFPPTIEAFADTLAELGPRRPFILGGGSNSLFPDDTFARPVVATERLNRLERLADGIRADCGVRLGRLISAALQWGFAGLEGFVGIPAMVGGAVVMNAGGAAGISFGDLVRELALLRLDTLEVIRVRGSDVPWRYRSWGLGGFAVLWAELALERASTAELRSRARVHFERKRRTQPLALPSAGCIFKNPEGLSAAQIIDRLGLKGLRRGGAEVSTRHANFIVNRDGARAADVRWLIREIQDRVLSSHGVRLETEVILVEDA